MVHWAHGEALGQGRLLHEVIMLSERADTPTLAQIRAEVHRIAELARRHTLAR